MAISYLNSTHTHLLMDALEVLTKKVSYDDYLILPLVLLLSLYVFNRGSILPKSDPYHHKWFWKPQDGMLHDASPSKRTRNIAEKIKESSFDVVIFWGSQSGTAEAFAHRLARDFYRRFRLKALVADISDYDPDTITLIPESTLCIFIVSTYGEGDPSDNAQDFITWATSATGVSLEHLQYAAFGCGNSNYRYYNKVVDDVVAALSKFRANAVVSAGKGNEATRTTEEDFVEWKDELFKTLTSSFGYKEYDVDYEPSVDVVYADPKKDTPHIGQPHYKATSKKAATQNSAVVSAPIKAMRELVRYDGQGRSVIDLEVDFSASPEVKYKTGDHIAIWPVNPEDEINSLFELLGLKRRKKEVIEIIPKSAEEKDTKVPSPTTIQVLFQHYLEICAPVPRESALSLIQFAPTEKMKTELRAIGKTRETYATFLEMNHITLARLLRHTVSIDPSAEWTTLPLSFVVDILPAIQPRLYSISSSRITSPRHVSLTVSVKPSQLVANPGTTISGLTSTYLSRLKLTQSSSHGQLDTKTPTVYAQIRGSTFKLPVLPSVPLIMVAAGTGIAPFRAFLRERARLASVGKDVGNMTLFFGCQSEADYLYHDEISEMVAGPLNGKLEVTTAFSRGSGTKMYVQHRLQARGEDVGRLLLEKDAAFYICGAANMAKAVGGVVRDIVKQAKSWDDSQVEDWRQERKRSKRWFEDVWS
ncbi:NADPH cytochrome p450 [Colletotrichum karsti]|uniref:NADPH--cytochrome P450 reductase n=1 Tax=Colletotrichum karsti TaxID=1095194 RepID=A0A9P6HXV8_9PEZI|nr:NADPH cytochrome p450 [Colletotrichum karsti]KAF9872150.1 NADPH cytochrome p450 [Colletotrichum karsti]